VKQVLKSHRAYRSERQAVDKLVAAVPGATVRLDGAPATHPWEATLTTLERAVRDHPELEPPTPRWHGLDHLRREDEVHRRLRHDRRKRAS
jgi:hypothetical protein